VLTTFTSELILVINVVLSFFAAQKISLCHEHEKHETYFYKAGAILFYLGELTLLPSVVLAEMDRACISPGII